MLTVGWAVGFLVLDLVLVVFLAAALYGGITAVKRHHREWQVDCCVLFGAAIFLAFIIFKTGSYFIAAMKFLF